jgi:hypothetical protein
MPSRDSNRSTSDRYVHLNGYYRGQYGSIRKEWSKPS